MKTITAPELNQHLDNKSAILIDVREPAEHSVASIDGALLIPLNLISLEKLPAGSKKPIVIHCRSGKRSEIACKALLEQDPSLDLYSLAGGILAWQQAGFSITQSNSKTIPIEQQTQLIAGLLIVAGTLAAVFIAQEFYILPAFVGLGLMFAGFTGWCGMAKLLATLPWNK